jgi:sulfite exporter TauE/SafE
MVKYDASILQQFADSLYAKARSVVVTYAILGLVLGGIGGLVLQATASFGRDLRMFESVVLWGPALLGLAWGFAHGQMKAFKYRLEAQQVLCQVQIEANTRRSEGVTCGLQEPTKAA